MKQVNCFLQTHVAWEQRSLLSSVKHCDPMWSDQSVSQACRRNPTEQERAGIHGETLGSTEQPNPQRVLAVSLRLLTLPYSTDFFINPLSKCFSLPHSTDKNTIPSIPTQRILFQLFPLVAAFGKPHSYFLTDV